MEILTSTDAVILYVSYALAAVAYLIHCQRRHVARKNAARRRNR